MHKRIYGLSRRVVAVVRAKIGIFILLSLLRKLENGNQWGGFQIRRAEGAHKAAD